MKKVIKLILVVGARPNFMKIAPLLFEIRKHNNPQGLLPQRSMKTPPCPPLVKGGQGGVFHIDYLLVHTGQHYDVRMSEAFFRDLNIPDPDINLEVGSGSHAVQTAEILIRFEKICLQEKPDWVIVVGDVNSTMACTLVAAKLSIKVAHIEAGLRSYDRSMPEEINRLVTDSLADLLFTPSEDADQNLLREGVAEDKIKRVGNIMIDTLMINLEKARALAPYRQYGLEEKKYVFVTLHRPSNVDSKESLGCIMQNLVSLSQRLPVIFPMHPRTEKNLIQYGIVTASDQYPHLNLCKPVGYFESIGFADKARFVLTDSGGLQEETTYLKIPCLTLRPNTERPITIRIGSNRLTSLETLQCDINRILEGSSAYGEIPELWDGRTGKRILEVLLRESRNGL